MIFGRPVLPPLAIALTCGEMRAGAGPKCQLGAAERGRPASERRPLRIASRLHIEHLTQGLGIVRWDEGEGAGHSARSTLAPYGRRPKYRNNTLAGNTTASTLNSA